MGKAFLLVVSFCDLSVSYPRIDRVKLALLALLALLAVFFQYRILGSF